MRSNAKLHHFDQFTVKTEAHPSGEFTAMDAEAFQPGDPIGVGLSRFAAIADLADEMRARGTLTEAAQ